MSAGRILVIDDNEDLAIGLSDVLELNGFEVDVIFTGRDGVRAAGNKSYDVIFIDVGLTDINGMDCAQRIRKGGSGARILLMTGYSARNIPAIGNGRNELELLSKPFDPIAVLERIGWPSTGNPSKKKPVL